MYSLNFKSTLCFFPKSLCYVYNSRSHCCVLRFQNNVHTSACRTAVNQDSHSDASQWFGCSVQGISFCETLILQDGMLDIVCFTVREFGNATSSILFLAAHHEHLYTNSFGKSCKNKAYLILMYELFPPSPPLNHGTSCLLSTPMDPQSIEQTLAGLKGSHFFFF